MKSNPKTAQHNNDLVICGTVKGSSRSKLFKQLGIESLKSRKTFNRLSSFHLINLHLLATHFPFSTQSPNSKILIKVEMQLILPHVNVRLILSNIPSFLIYTIYITFLIHTT